MTAQFSPDILCFMRFSKQAVAVAVEDITDCIASALNGEKTVLWLTSGGSCVDAQVRVMKRLRESVSSRLVNLSILPVDERYGVCGHADSNSEQMRQAGFAPDAAVWHDVLAGNLPFAETIDAYTEQAQAAFAAAEVVVATLGMGADGHIAGLLPNSPAVREMASSVVGYAWNDHERMTLGAAVLRQIDHVFLLVYGDTKQTALTRLRANTESFEDLPAKILYDFDDVTIYNEYIQT
ncbi:hypothetical protein CSA80_01150 [Candidatus Saccharibacteria bacterium]|nr:MAG: hypothetical protein CR973_02005 [Candidatus Saccharibacteria bacterium]PID99355.1 MAG: hypothetical protein CSA80_01150 [Candidatus Saccharibacteria bacterium]